MTAQIPYQHSSGYISHFHNNELDAGRGRDYNVTIKYLDDKEENIEGQAAKISHNASLHIPVLLCLVISLGGFIFGWDIGTIGGMTNMVSFQEKFGTTNLIHDDETIFVSRCPSGGNVMKNSLVNIEKRQKDILELLHECSLFCH